MKIAIVGSAAASCDLAPWDDPDWEIWGLAWRNHKRATALFEMHDSAMWVNHGGPNYVERLAKCTQTLYLLQPHASVPNGVTYPRQTVIDALSSHGEADFLTSSLAFLVALAICEQPEEIALYGCDMSATEEYAYQRPAMLYLVGLARGRGIKVYIPPQSSLARANFVYGDLSGSSGGKMQQVVGITEKLLTARLAKYNADRQATHDRMMAELARMNTLDGAIGEVNSLLEQARHFNRGGFLPDA